MPLLGRNRKRSCVQNIVFFSYILYVRKYHKSHTESTCCLAPRETKFNCLLLFSVSCWHPADIPPSFPRKDLQILLSWKTIVHRTSQRDRQTPRHRLSFLVSFWKNKRSQIPYSKYSQSVPTSVPSLGEEREHITF
jgi:hypothetical protein